MAPCRPVEHLKAASALYPEAWKHVEQLRMIRGKGFQNWPGWCFLPMAGWYSIVGAALQKSGKSPDGMVPLPYAGDIARLAAIGTWRYSQGIYQIDPDVFPALWSTPIPGNIPSDVLFRLPEWSVYVETPEKQFCGSNLYGFFAHLERDANNDDKELRLLLDTDTALIPLPIHIGDWLITTAIQQTMDEAKENAPSSIPLSNLDLSQAQLKNLSEYTAPMISLILYLCSDNPDFGPGKKPFRPLPTRTKKGWRLFPPPSPTVWNVGMSIGKQIREAKEADSSSARSGVRPHLRRAHWHGYRIGPKSKPQEFRYHWLPPILVKEFEPPK